MLVFVRETTHKFAAKSADLGGIKRKTLILRHFDGDVRKLAHMIGTAARSSARRDSAQHFALVASTDLAQFYARMKSRREFSYEVAKINSIIGGKIDNQFCSVKRIFRVDRLHIKFTRRYLFGGDAHNFVVLLLELSHFCLIAVRRKTNYRLKRLNDFVLADFARQQRNRRVFESLRGFDDYAISLRIVKFACLEIINLGAFFEFYSNDFRHLALTSNNEKSNSSNTD